MDYELNRIECDGCKRWIKKLGFSDEIAMENGWYGFMAHAKNHKFGSYLWFCPSCQKKITLEKILNILTEKSRRSLEAIRKSLTKEKNRGKVSCGKTP